ncbi:hypothetical protein COOONC_15707 [Cooperia oncophora]
MQESFLNPTNHVPFLEEMKQAYARRNGSILDTVSELPATSLMEFMVGRNACRRLRGSGLMKEVYHIVQKIKENHKQLDASITAKRCFPKFTSSEEIVVENYALRQPALISFMNGVLNYVVPKELLSAQQRTDLIKFIADRLVVWRSGTRLLAENETYPPIEYAVIEKEVKLHLMKLWAYCDNDKYLTQAVLDGISANLTHFFALYALHSLRTQTKIGMRDDIASFYYIHTYNEIKRHIPVKSEPGKTRSFSMSGDDSETFTTMPPIKSETPVNHTPADSKGTAASTSNSACTKEAALWYPHDEQLIEWSIKQHCQRRNGFTVYEANEDGTGLLDKGMTGLRYLKFPRDRPPDDIPVYDYTKVKREKLDPISSQTETESQISNDSSSNHLSAVDEWEDVLKSVLADQSIPEGYKMAFRLVIRFLLPLPPKL